ncbi:MAG: toxin-antitoxin system YwqK family antitoxin [Fusobacteriaceae bacterium]|jgi:antitoxin component YwqK of YwqJK toxin-antitoxin module|nr:toxin-antitoxin system YwqK family antitoxin [Fusobacteriaceae bacterium]
MKRLVWTLLLTGSFLVMGAAHEIDINDAELRGRLIYRKGSDEPYSGQLRILYRSGKTDSVHQIRDGLEEGRRNSWYENGRLREDGNYARGRREGVHRAWFENGHPQFEITYRDGVYDGVAREYYENGQLRGEANYAAGAPTGPYRLYYENGALNEEGVFETKTEELTVESALQRQGLDFSMRPGPGGPGGPGGFGGPGGRERTVAVSASAGTVRAVASDARRQAPMAAPELPRAEFRARTSIARTMTTREYKLYYESGQLLESGRFVNGFPDGGKRSFYENGNLKLEANYRRGLPDGIWKEYGPDGKLKAETSWRGGRQDGPFRIYNDAGNLIREEQYRNGRLMKK